MSSFEKGNVTFGEVPKKLWLIFFIRLFAFLILSFKSIIYVLDINILSDIKFANIFSLSWFVSSY